MTNATTLESVSPKLLMVAKRAQKDPRGKLLALARLLDEPALMRAYGRLKKGASVGVDGVTVEAYGQQLADNVRALCERMKAGKYRHQPIRRVHIPKEDGSTRPIGISSVEDKIVQGAIAEVLEAIYEPAFVDGSYGFRRGRGAHDALRTLDREVRKGSIHVILEADIRSFFDNIDRKMLMEMLRERIADESFMRLIGKCLNVGVLEGEEYSEPTTGTTQGSVLSPMLGNIYLHHVLDEWFETEIRPRLRGHSVLIRYADDFLIGFERHDDAERVMEILPKRMERYGLTLHPDKTRLVPFEPPQGGEGGGATFDFLGFTVHWRRTRRGSWGMTFRTRRARIRRATKAAADWCESHRHLSVKEQHAALCRRLNGHINYFGVNGNVRSLSVVVDHARSAWRKWLNRRSQRGKMPWWRFKQLLLRYPLPTARVTVQIWGR